MQANSETESGVNWDEATLPFPFWIGTVSEAVFLIGTERNADVVRGASYVSVVGSSFP